MNKILIEKLKRVWNKDHNIFDKGFNILDVILLDINVLNNYNFIKINIISMSLKYFNCIIKLIIN